MERLVPACDNVVADGMEVFTNSPMAREARRANLRLILSEHDTSCTSCSRSGNCTLQSLANDFNMRAASTIPPSCAGRRWTTPRRSSARTTSA